MENLPGNRESTYLGFRIENETFAINAENVIEVVRNEGVTSVPKTADYVEGIINFRGDILSVVNARKKLNIPERQDAIKKVIIVIEFETNGNTSTLGIIADKVTGVLNLQEKDIQPVLEFGNYYNPEYLRGALRVKDKIITILNIEKIFSEEEVRIIKSVKDKKITNKK
ncbi:MAG: purine-binding chemotaxis protein CheW [Bacteroidales bacterium]|nr:purine-binding chemotaxis protein CheW [Bacteroidales bacterium]